MLRPIMYFRKFLILFLFFIYTSAEAKYYQNTIYTTPNIYKAIAPSISDLSEHLSKATQQYFTVQQSETISQQSGILLILKSV
jgi:hypothetical protein